MEVPNFCFECKEVFSEAETNKVYCFGACKHIFHMTCISMKEEEFNLLKGNMNIKWFCNECLKSVSNTPSSTSTSTDTEIPGYETASTSAATNSSEDEIDPNTPRRRRGSPRILTANRRPEQKIGRIWEFLRNLLQNPEYCPNLICWEDYQTKKFRIVDAQKVAELWGKRKNCPNMTYEKFSRAIRHYYKDQVIVSVPKEKLVYRFGENARGIETDNPNFGKPVNSR